jgi:DNA-binding YbaB/EbfC family protein
MFKGIANLASLMRNAGEISGKMEEITQTLRDRIVVGSAGGEMVQVRMNGLSQVIQVSIDPLLMEKGDREMLENLLPAAINQALTKAKQAHLDAMKELTGGFELPGLDKMFQQFTGDEDTMPPSPSKP